MTISDPVLAARGWTIHATTRGTSVNKPNDSESRPEIRPVRDGLRRSTQTKWTPVGNHGSHLLAMGSWRLVDDLSVFSNGLVSFTVRLQEE
jgi:hypothetical protein